MIKLTDDSACCFIWWHIRRFVGHNAEFLIFEYVDQNYFLRFADNVLRYRCLISCVCMSLFSNIYKYKKEIKHRQSYKTVHKIKAYIRIRKAIFQHIHKYMIHCRKSDVVLGQEATQFYFSAYAVLLFSFSYCCSAFPIANSSIIFFCLNDIPIIIYLES